MSKFTRDVIENSKAIREEMSKILQDELIENDKYIQQIKEAAEPVNRESSEIRPTGRDSLYGDGACPEHGE